MQHRMRVESLKASSLPLPDLVAFNRRIRERTDPWLDRPWVRRLGYLFAAGFVLFAGMWLYFASGLPSSEKLLAYQPSLPTNVRGYDGTPVQTFARERRVELSYEEYPPMVVQAFISAEDKTFFSHGGLDYPGLIGAVFDFTTKTATGGGRAKGGSTITQQVAKYLLQDSSYSIGRKAREAILAFRLESTLSKEQILEIYLNSIFLGRNAYGVQAASRAYFDKDVHQLTLPEAAYLAVLPKAPSNYDPVRATQKALDRRNYVLREMENNGYITADQRAAAATTGLGTIRYGSNEKFRQQGGYFMEEVRRIAHQALRREGRGRTEQRLCGRPLGPHVHEPGHAGRRRQRPSRRPCAVRRRAWLARYRQERRPHRRLGWRARPHADRHRLPGLEEGCGPSKELQPRRASASPTDRSARFRVGAALMPKRAAAARPSTISSREWSSS